jgi:hypothetical protein
VAQRVGRGIALLFHDRGTRRGWVVSSTPRPHITPGKDPIPILLEAGWSTGPVWTSGKSRPHRDSIPDRPARSQSLYRLDYPAHVPFTLVGENCYHTTIFNKFIWLVCYVFVIFVSGHFSFTEICLINVISCFLMRGLNLIILVFCGVW